MTDIMIDSNEVRPTMADETIELAASTEELKRQMRRPLSSLSKIADENCVSTELGEFSVPLLLLCSLLRRGDLGGAELLCNELALQLRLKRMETEAGADGIISGGAMQ